MASYNHEVGDLPAPTAMPLGDGALLLRFSTRLDDGANRAAGAFARILLANPVSGVIEIVPNLASVLVRYDPARISYQSLAGELALVVARPDKDAEPVESHIVSVHFGGEAGPDLEEAAQLTGLSQKAFVIAHCSESLRVLATGFAPGFVYCGFHPKSLEVPRRTQIRQAVPAGSVLFAAGQTAITSTSIPTGWHVVGQTDLRNFDPEVYPPTRLTAGDMIRFEAV